MPEADREREPIDPGTGDLERLLEILRRRAGLIVLCTLVTAVAAVGFSLLQEKQYTASTSLLFRDPEFTQSVFGSEGETFSGGDAARQAATNVELVGLREISDRTAADPEVDISGSAVHEAIEASAEGQSDVVTVSATDPDPEFAALLANTFAREFIDFRAEADRSRLLQAKRLADREFEQLSPEEQEGPRGSQLSRGAERLGIMASLQTGNAELVQAAEVPEAPSSPKPVRNGVLGLIVGLMLGVGLAVLFERLNRTIRTPEEAGDAYGLPVIGTVPESEAIERSNQGDEDASLPFAEHEAFRMIRASLRYFSVDRGISTLLVTSATAQEGKSTVAWNLANVAATRDSVLLLETDLRNPTLARQHGINSGPGLAELLTNQIDLPEAIQSHDLTSGSNGAAASARTLDVVVGGATPPNPAELLESQAIVEILAEFSERYDLVVVDTPPAGVVADCLPLLNIVSGTLVVTRLGQTTSDAASGLMDNLQRSSAPVLGLVANAVKVGRKGRYGYGYGYGYGARGETAEKASSPG